MTTSVPIYLTQENIGFKLTDIHDVIDALVNNNAASTSYGISAVGSTQSTATQLKSVINQVDNIVSSGGVNLPLSTGRKNTPYRMCVIINNSGSSIQVYGATSGHDTINGTAGSTGISQSSGVTTLYISGKPGSWVSITGGGGGGGSGTGRIFTGSGAVNLLSTDGIVEIAPAIAQATTVNIPNTLNLFQIYTVVDGSGTAGNPANRITLVPASGNISGQSFYQMNSNYQSTSFYWNGTNIRIV